MDTTQQPAVIVTGGPGGMDPGIAQAPLERGRRVVSTSLPALVLVKDDIGLVLARYEFLVDGKVEQYGTDLFNLILCTTWRIAGTTYNSRQSRTL